MNALVTKRVVVKAVAVTSMLAAAAAVLSRPIHAAVKYPFTATLDAKLTLNETAVSSKITLRVNRQIETFRRTRSEEAFQYGGYPKFFDSLRDAPAVGSIATPSAKVDIQFTREEQQGEVTRLVLVANKPLFFVGRDPDKKKTGYELTYVDIRVTADGKVSGQMAGAARLRRSNEGEVLLDTYSGELIQLEGKATTP